MLGPAAHCLEQPLSDPHGMPRAWRRGSPATRVPNLTRQRHGRRAASCQQWREGAFTEALKYRRIEYLLCGRKWTQTGQGMCSWGLREHAPPHPADREQGAQVPGTRSGAGPGLSCRCLGSPRPHRGFSPPRRVSDFWPTGALGQRMCTALGRQLCSRHSGRRRLTQSPSQSCITTQDTHTRTHTHTCMYPHIFTHHTQVHTHTHTHTHTSRTIKPRTPASLGGTKQEHLDTPVPLRGARAHTHTQAPLQQGLHGVGAGAGGDPGEGQLLPGGEESPAVERTRGLALKGSRLREARGARTLALPQPGDQTQTRGPGKPHPGQALR